MRQRLEDMADHPRCPAVDSLAVDLFAKDMKRKLAKNVHKRHWLDHPLNYLYERLRQEQEELYFAIQSGNAGLIVDECADVANISMMIAEVAKHEE